MSPISGNPNLLVLTEATLNGKGRVLIPRAARRVLNVEADGKVTVSAYDNRTVHLRKKESGILEKGGK